MAADFKSATRTSASCPKWEIQGVFVLSLLFLIVNLLTATRYPFVWIDEVMYSDPAVNLYLSKGFTSSAWYAQAAGEFWAGNVPLHSVLLYLWIKLFGLSITAIRSINYVYLVAAALLFWRASMRLDLLRTSRARLLLLLLIGTGYSMIFAYRSGRPDCLTMLLAAASVYVYSLNSRGWRIFSLAALGLLMPWAGLQLLPMLAVTGFLLWLWVGGKMLPPVLAMLAGAAAGVLSIYGFYKNHGVWPQFVASVHQHTTIGFFGWLAHGQLRHSNLVPKDFSFMILLPLAALLAIHGWRHRKVPPEISFGLAYSVVLTVALIYFGKFPTYYGWMTYVPLCLCLCMGLEKMRPTGVLRLICAAFLAGAILIGTGLHAAAALYDWRDRNYNNVENLVRENISPDDSMYGEFSTYYAAKRLARQVYMPLYLAAFRENEKAGTTVLVISPRDLTDVTNVIGGNWVSTGRHFTPQRSGFLGTRRNLGFLSTQNYELEVYRRAH